jgi:hypothetical protein
MRIERNPPESESTDSHQERRRPAVDPTVPLRSHRPLRRRGRPWLRGALVLGLLATLQAGRRADGEAWPGPPGAGQTDAGLAGAAALGADDVLVRARRLCVVSDQATSGELSPQIAYRRRREGDRLIVSYFVHWSTERPWGDHSVMASLAIDAVYSHLLFFFPGLRFALYGPGDVEGATVAYRDAPSGLEVIEGVADDGEHRLVRLESADLSGADGSTVLMTRRWSHQLGAAGAARAARRARSEGLQLDCFEDDRLVPMTPTIAERFRLGSAEAPRRARPAWR